MPVRDHDEFDRLSDVDLQLFQIIECHWTSGESIDARIDDDPLTVAEVNHNTFSNPRPEE